MASARGKLATILVADEESWRHNLAICCYLEYALFYRSTRNGTVRLSPSRPIGTFWRARSYAFSKKSFFGALRFARRGFGCAGLARSCQPSGQLIGGSPSAGLEDFSSMISDPSRSLIRRLMAARRSFCW